MDILRKELLTVILVLARLPAFINDALARIFGAVGGVLSPFPENDIVRLKVPQLFPSQIMFLGMVVRRFGEIRRVLEYLLGKFFRELTLATFGYVRVNYLLEGFASGGWGLNRRRTHLVGVARGHHLRFQGERIEIIRG